MASGQCVLYERRKRTAIIRIQWTKFDTLPISSSRPANVSSLLFYLFILYFKRPQQY